MASQTQQTGAENAEYNLVSVLYHALKGASTCLKFIEDAERAGDPQMVEFFRDAQEQQRSLAERAKNLIGTQWSGAPSSSGEGAATRQTATVVVNSPTNSTIKSGGKPGDDAVDELSKESFPASDPPSSY